jgi:hypothetical protein
MLISSHRTRLFQDAVRCTIGSPQNGLAKRYSFMGALLGLLLWGQVALAQPPSLIWQKALGGSKLDYGQAVTATVDGGVVVAGYTPSNDGDVSGNHGGDDYWVVKLNAAGQKLWQKTLGGTGTDQANAITASGDGGVVVVGYTYSNDGDVSGNHGNGDIWVVKLDANGAKVWQKTLGGTGTDQANAITASGDGGVVVAGYTYSNDGDVSGNHGNGDMWVVKLDANGAKVWQKCLGGTNQETARAITASGDGGYMVAGYAYSNDGDVSGNHGNGDMWVVKLDANGAKVWQKTLGGTDKDYGWAITASGDGSVVVAGWTNSTNGDAIGNHGSYDYLVVKLDAAGQKLWQKCLGGSGDDVAQGITASGDGGVVMVGYTDSKDGDVSGFHGFYDYWVVKLDAAGQKLWQKCLGGPISDIPYGITTSGDGDYVVAGYTSSTDGDVSGFHGGDGDYWVVKLGSTTPTVNDLIVTPSPVCAGQLVQFIATVGKVTGSYSYTLTNGTDINQMGSSSASAFSRSVIASGQGSQTFTLRVEAANGVGSATVLLAVNALPNASFSGLAATYCTNAAAVTLVPTTAGGTFYGPGISGTSFIPAQAGNGGIITYKVTANGCSSSSSQNVTVTSSPNVSFSGLAPTYCANATAITLIPTTAGGTFSGPGVSATTFTPANAGAGGAITYSVTVNGCTSSSSQNVIVTPLPNASFSGLTATYCANAGAATLIPATSGGTFSGPGVSGNTFAPANAVNGGTITYSVTVNGCTASSTQNVTIAPLPNASLTNNGPITDTNPIVTLAASGGNTYAFSAGTSQQGGSNTATVISPGIYQVTVTNQGCSAIASTLVTGAASTSSCRNGTAVITVVASGTPVKYEWYRNSINSARLTENPAQVRGTSTASLTLVNQQVTAAYYVRVTDQNGSAVVYGPFKMTVDLNCNVYARKGEEGIELKITLLGNPVQGDQLRAVINGAEGKVLSVQLLDLQGRSVYQQQWQRAESNQSVEWNLSGQASGVYLLQANTDVDATIQAQRHSVKLIKP